MMIFCMLNSRCFGTDWTSPILQNIIQYIMCCFITMEDKMLQSQVSCRHFLYLSQPKPLCNWLMETRDMPKLLGLFYVVFITFPLYIQWGQFTIFRVTLSTQYHQLPSNYILVFKSLHLKLFNIVTLLFLKAVLEYHTTRLKNNYNIFKY